MILGSLVDLSMNCVYNHIFVPQQLMSWKDKRIPKTLNGLKHYFNNVSVTQIVRGILINQHLDPN